MTAAQISRIYEHGSQLDDELFKEYRKRNAKSGIYSATAWMKTYGVKR